MKRVLMCVTLLVWSTMASAVVYKWIDAQGKLQYGDRPPDGVHAEVVPMTGKQAVQSAQFGQSRPAGLSEAHGPPTSSTSTATPVTTANASIRDDSAKKTVDEDVAQARDKQCAEAQERYKKLIEGRKLYKSGPDGERQYLTSAQIDAERLDSKHDVDSVCNSPT